MEPSSSHPGIFGTHWAKWRGNGKFRDKPARHVPSTIAFPAARSTPCRVLLLIFQMSRIKKLFGGKEQFLPCKTWPGLASAASHGHPHRLPFPSSRFQPLVWVLTHILWSSLPFGRLLIYVAQESLATLSFSSKASSAANHGRETENQHSWRGSDIVFHTLQLQLS